MGLTQFSYVLLPACLIWALRPSVILQVMIVASIFEAAAALTLGNLGVQPGLLPGLCFIAYVTLQMLLGVRYPGEYQAWRLCLPLVLVTVWAVLGSFLLPRLFEGQVYVWPQKEIPPFVIMPLAPSPTNLNQDCYLILNCLLVVLAAMFLTKTGLKLKRFMTMFFASGFLAAAVAAWQFANRVAGVPFPSDFFYSNPGWSLLTAQRIGVVPRINGSFAEPSALASYMSSIVCASGWLLLQGNRDRIVAAAFITGIVSMVMSTSTTGFGVLAIVTLATPVLTLLGGGGVRSLGSIFKIGVPLVTFFVILGFAASLFVPNFSTNVSEVLNATLNKQQSSSFEDRTSADLDSLTATLQTFGLGAGWGSNRSSSLLPGLLAGIGIPGVIGLLWFATGITRRVHAVRRRRPTAEQRFVIDGCCGGLAGFLLSALISAPTLSSVSFFFLLALLIGATARATLEQSSLP